MSKEKGRPTSSSLGDTGTSTVASYPKSKRESATQRTLSDDAVQSVQDDINTEVFLDGPFRNKREL